jgi:hypothetical protein
MLGGPAAGRVKSDVAKRRAAALLEKLTVTELLNKFSVFCVAWKFIAVFTKASHLSVSSARLILPKGLS